MSVYMVAEVKKKDKQKYNEYIAALTEIIERYGGRYLVRGGRMTPLFKGRELERRHPDKILIVEFPTAADHIRCFTSRNWPSLRFVTLRPSYERSCLKGMSPTSNQRTPTRSS